MSMFMKDGGFDIPPKSAALVFNDDGTIDARIPTLKDDEDISTNVLCTVSLMLLLGDGESQIWKLINDKIEEMIRETKNGVAMEE